ncbi:MAG TPA: LysR family transcriptional regulator [Ktedonobacterales bacterium]|nr:LysR family transcriptional regulator [Ktedonobacterales bacterium]
MTLDQLETFVFIARIHSFSRAAVLLGLAQPTLSGRIGALEAELGSQLFLRHGHTLELSETGRALLPYAERMLALRAEGMAEVQRLHSGGLGRLALGANLSASQYLVPRLIEIFHHQHPESLIRVRTATSPALMESLLDGVIQLAICSQAQIEPRAQVLWSYSDPLVLVASHTHPLARIGECSRADLASHTILSTRAGPTLLGLRHVLPPGGETPIAIEANAGEVMTQLLRRGLGVTVLPTIAIWGELARGELVSIRVRDAVLPTYDVALVQWSGRTLAPAALAFAEMVGGVRVSDVLGDGK